MGKRLLFVPKSLTTSPIQEATSNHKRRGTGTRTQQCSNAETKDKLALLRLVHTHFARLTKQPVIQPMVSYVPRYLDLDRLLRESDRFARIAG